MIRFLACLAGALMTWYIGNTFIDMLADPLGLPATASSAVFGVVSGCVWVHKGARP